MDVLAPTTMKNAAKCDTSCELQNPVSHQNFERNLHFSLRSMSVGVSVHPHHLSLVGQRSIWVKKESASFVLYTTHTSASDDNNALGVSQETLSSLVLINEKTIIVLFFGRKTDERRDVMKKHTSFIFMKSETAPFRSDLQSVKITR